MFRKVKRVMSLSEELCARERRIWREVGIEEGIEKGREEGIEEGIEKGRYETILDNVSNLMDSLAVSADEAMDLLRIQEGLRERIRAEIAGETASGSP